MTKKLDLSKTIKTRNGFPVRIIATDYNGSDGENIVAIVKEMGFDELMTYYSDGHYLSTKDDYPYDLVNVPEKHIGWVNIFRNHSGSNYLSSYISEDKAETKRRGETSEKYVATARVEWEE